MLALIGVGCKHKASANGGPTQVAIKSLDGRDVTVAQYKGKVVLVNFWATWCEPCKIEIPELIQLQAKYEPKGFTILGVAMDDDGKSVVAHSSKETAMTLRGGKEVSDELSDIAGQRRNRQQVWADCWDFDDGFVRQERQRDQADDRSIAYEEYAKIIEGNL